MQVFLGDPSGGMKVELLEPWDAEQHDFLERFVTRHGPGPHHLTFKVADLEATIERVRAAGYTPVGINLADPQWQEAFLQPKEAHGTVVQLAHSNATLASPLAEYEYAAEHGPSGDPVWWTTPPSRAAEPTFLRCVVLRDPGAGARARLLRRAPPRASGSARARDGPSSFGRPEDASASRSTPTRPRASTGSSSRAPGRRGS